MTGMVPRLRSIAGYAAGVAAIIIVFVTFAGNDRLALAFARFTGITVSPRYTGGEVIKTVDHGTYRTLIHRPVFDGLFSERSTGFIQVNWKGKGPYPTIVEERLDIDGDGAADVLLRFDTKTLSATQSGHPWVTGIEETYRLDDGFAVRVALKKAHGKDIPDARP